MSTDDLWMKRQRKASRRETHSFVDGKDGADGGQAVDVAGAVQRVETHHVLPLEQKPPTYG